MSSSNSTDVGRQPCEDESCRDGGQQTFYCVHCDSNFCGACWDRQLAHRPNKRGPDGHAHEKVDRLVIERYRSIMEPSSNLRELDELHRLDEDTEWFGVGRNQANDPIFEDYGRYATLMAQSLSQVHKSRYPKLVSFIGQTGAGKSTVVKLLINYQTIRDNPALKISEFPSPVIGSVDENLPTSANVHLYADPRTIMTDAPILYADCEGLEGGESTPKAEEHKLQDRTFTARSRSIDSHFRRRLHRKGQGISRKLSWAVGDKEKSKREYAVTELYPKLLYTFSDVVVFVLRNSKTFESAVLTKLIGWALISLEKSLGQPALPHVIIALNATDLSIDPTQWNVAEATRKLLSDVQKSVEKVPALQEVVERWRANGRSIKTTRDLLECYYSSVTVVRIPTKGRYMLIDEQVGKLHSEIVEKCVQSHSVKRRVRMLSNSDDLQLYLQLAFDHFSQNLYTPFNFIEMALKINPIPSDFSGNIVKLAVAIKHRQPLLKVSDIFGRLSHMVASCIMLDIHRHRRLGTPEQLLEDHYLHYCEQAFNDFCDRHWPCSFQKKDSHCVKVYIGHSTKGHQNAAGKILGSGEYVPSFNYYDDLAVWIKSLERGLDLIQESKDKESLRNLGSSSDDLIPQLHSQTTQVFYSKIGSSHRFISHSTCFCCLREIPVHPLPCGHVICTRCVQSYGVPQGKGFFEMSRCPLDQATNSWPQSCHINIKPPLAGVRILSLDGGGMRGIVELIVLKAIQKQLPERIPIRSFFDLIVGTSTGGIIALGLGIEGWSVDRCIQHFSDLCVDAFSPREMHGVPFLEKVAAWNHKFSRYKTRPFEKILRDSFMEQPLFGGPRDRSRSMVKVAVTATRDTGEKAVLLTNYNRSFEKDNKSHYEFERAEQPDRELNVWEAARATSAAPSYFKEFRSERNNRGYLDGALYYNNPVRVADLERRLIWPDTEHLPPDILLSIGTGCNDPIQQKARNSLDHNSRLYSPRSSTAVTGQGPAISSNKSRGIHMHKVFRIMRSRVEDVLDTEITWHRFMSDVTRGNENDEGRYQRVNPNIKEDPPKLDETNRLFWLRTKIHHLMEDGVWPKELGKIARRLVASSFYVETATSPASPTVYNTVFAGTIQCRFPSDSAEIRSLGDYFKNASTEHFQPHFVIGGTSLIAEPVFVEITPEVIRRMVDKASFEVQPIRVSSLTETAIVRITLSTSSGEEFPISGFPRATMTKKPANFSTPSSPKVQRRSFRHVGTFERTGEDSSSRTSESSDQAFPELQQLPREVKRPIWRFLQDRILSLQKRNDDVPIKLQLLAEATEDKMPVSGHDEWPPNALQTDADAGVGPYGTILHAAAAIGNQWIVELQIKAGVDVSIVDDHCWTPLMVATAQRHLACAKLLLNQMPVTQSDRASGARFPDGLRKGHASPSVDIGEDQVTAGFLCAGITHLRDRIQLRSNHPIPPSCKGFYYELTVLNTGPDKFVGLGLCRPESPAFGMPGWAAGSWGYHGDTGLKFSEHGAGIRYGDTFSANDTIGCGINSKTGRVFFTKNGVQLGVAFSGVFGMLFPIIGVGERHTIIRANLGQFPFIYNLAEHDWDSTKTAVELRSQRLGFRPKDFF